MLPFGLDEADPLKNTVWPTAGDDGENVKLAVGDAAAVTVTFCVDDPDLPALSVTVRRATNVPAAEYV